MAFFDLGNLRRTSAVYDPLYPAVQVVGSSMQLIGDHQAEDRQLISEVVLAKMNQALTTRSSSASRSPARSPQGQKPTTVQPQQVTELCFYWSG